MPEISPIASTASPAQPSSPTSPWLRALRELAALWKVAWPILLGQLAIMGMSTIEVAMAGHVSAPDLAVVSLGVSTWNVTIITIMGLMMSVAPLVAHAYGARDLDEIPGMVRQALWKAVFIGLAGMLVMWLAAWALQWLTAEARVREQAQHFIVIVSFGIPAFAGYRALYSYSTSISQTKPIMVVSVGCLLLNALLNWLLVFGNWGLPALGGMGCAWATLACAWFNLLGLGLWVRYGAVYHTTSPLREQTQLNLRLHWPTQRQLMRLGLPIGITFFAETCAFSLIGILIARFGSTEMAAHQVALNFISIVFMLPLSLSTAVLARVGQALGAGTSDVARYRAWLGVVLGFITGCVMALVMGLGGSHIASAYTADAAVAERATVLLGIAALFQVFDTVQVIASNALRSYKVTRLPMLLYLTAFWGVSLPLGCLLGWAPKWLPSWMHPAQPLGAVGFWVGLAVGLPIAAFGMIYLLQRTARRTLPALSALPTAAGGHA
ncbi:MATE family efflux transporter [Curvibacter sp. CHRR-16]|uniref:MATE family efflux transporter n=1 Tax=Curvibacter sp. CHRR-16 TaxID=2835872 RepID=UPI001BDAC037|nr:MATE family efflux transporter [Curvibacter sp. CHRR-16]MBT0569060.1 MATE family efflux transporter [Curvibacter sp. CHRR-16]